MKFTATIIATAALVAAVAADYAAVQTDVSNIQVSVGKLYQALKATSGTSYSEALAIDSAAKALIKDINAANTDAQAVDNITDDQAKSVISVLSDTYVNVTGASQRLIDLQPAFKKLGVAGIAKTDTNNVASATKTFAATLVDKTPEASKDSASKLASDYNNALASAVAAYA
ncbi:unnamed protein product [Tilletia controversa]|uniref:Hydrophobic surface binding protein n=2 Tax=Tilletia TaxID=13289 RepID=A0A8X7MRI4_9BASI|nr:hypothetical protein CF336_g1775 [Tilletia laevis]KAE8204246.1 hypothetical protein CF328_g1185 [Tilletia controversa]KAE8264011.1 hypothetical protein A4X03_0g1254 [Tilletia caries]KAE8207451.1 hypothetical protein CF335_g1135 [Tilletia laevis]KAE8245849.1 hypothetical protein A4X06_0g5376 [Tilletia controversa]